MTADGLAQRRSPLQHLGALPAGSPARVRLAELPFRSQIELRADPDAAVVGRWEAALGVPLPRQAGGVTGGESRQVLWLGPDWWLVTDDPDVAGGLEPALATTLRGTTGGAGSVVDVSAARTTLELSGPHARTVLEHGCSLDLHPRAFRAGHCAQTTLAKAQVVLHQTGPDSYRILVRASYADYLARWLLDAMTEYLTP